MTQNSSHHFFAGLLLAVFVLAGLIFLPFLTPIVIALTLSVIFSPLHRWISKVFFKNKERSTFSALISLLIVALIVVIPALFIVGKLYAEVQDMYFYLTEEAGRSNVINLLNSVSSFFSKTFFDIYPAYTFESLNITDYLQNGLEWAFSHLDTLFTSISGVLLGAFVSFFSLFYFFRDGRELKKQLIAISPLGDADDERIMNRLEQAVYSIVAGSLIVGVIQGILTGIGFGIFGVPSPAIWGSIAAVAALIPGVGTSLVIVPAIIYLFVNGSMVHAIGLTVWGLLAVGLIDNLLGPILVNRGIKIHPLLVLLSVLGGLIFFGPIGFILGPLVLAFLSALLEIYRTSRI